MKYELTRFSPQMDDSTRIVNLVRNTQEFLIENPGKEIVAVDVVAVGLETIIEIEADVAHT